MIERRARKHTGWTRVRRILFSGLAAVIVVACSRQVTKDDHASHIGQARRALTSSTDICTANVLNGAGSLPALNTNGTDPPTAGCAGSDCAADCTNRCVIEQLIASVPDHGAVCFPITTGTRGAYEVSGSIAVGHPVTIWGLGGAIWQRAAGGNLFAVNASGVRISGMRLIGPNAALAYVSNENAISAVGPMAPNLPLTGLRFDHNEIMLFGYQGIVGKWIQFSDFSDNYIHDIGYGGIIVMSATNGTIARNRIDSLLGEPGSNVLAYGVGVTRDNNLSLMQAPPSTDYNVSGNLVSNVTSWEAFDTHCGERISFVANNATNVRSGVAVGPCLVPAAASLAPQDVIVAGNILNSMESPEAPGISFNGVSDGGQLATGVVSNNVVTGFGKAADAYAGGIYAFYTRGLVLSGNVVRKSQSLAVSMGSNYDAIVSNNALISPGVTGGLSLGIHAYPSQTGFIGGNSFYFDSSSPTPRGMHIDEGLGSISTGASFFDNLGEGLDIWDPGGHLFTPLTRRVSINSGAEIKKHLSSGIVSIAWSSWSGSCTQSCYATASVSLTGSQLGDTVTVGFNTAPPTDASITGTVTGADTVSLTCVNLSGATQVLPTQARVDVWQHD